MVSMIMLVTLLGWLAIVSMVIKPPFWLGAILSIIGGIAIGTVVAYLIRRWGFKGITVGRRHRWGKVLFDETETHRKPEFGWGTNFVYAAVTYRYARAGEDLKPGTIVEADLAGRIVPEPEYDTVEITSELIWGNVKATKDVDEHGANVLGWPVVNVKKGRCCWLRQPPLGAEFKKEAD